MEDECCDRRGFLHSAGETSGRVANKPCGRGIGGRVVDPGDSQCDRVHVADVGVGFEDERGAVGHQAIEHVAVELGMADGDGRVERLGQHPPFASGGRSGECLKHQVRGRGGDGADVDEVVEHDHGRMHVGIDEARDHGAAVEIEHLGAGIGEVAQFPCRADGRDPSVADGDGLGDRRGRIEGVHGGAEKESFDRAGGTGGDPVVRGGHPGEAGRAHGTCRASNRAGSSDDSEGAACFTHGATLRCGAPTASSIQLQSG